ncbi:hypothetical protein FRAHR75_200049 [Frankia sp. Hr75.2]|nr:hypothetical protein FRAHR75_200049 [Frankia sp. Hr75.2]
MHAPRSSCGPDRRDLGRTRQGTVKNVTDARVLEHNAAEKCREIATAGLRRSHSGRPSVTCVTNGGNVNFGGISGGTGAADGRGPGQPAGSGRAQASSGRAVEPVAREGLSAARGPDGRHRRDAPADPGRSRRGHAGDGSADAQLLAGQRHLVAWPQLAAPAGLDLAVDADAPAGQHRLDLRTRLDDVGELEELAEPDDVAVDAHFTHSLSMPDRRPPTADRTGWRDAAVDDRAGPAAGVVTIRAAGSGGRVELERECDKRADRRREGWLEAVRNAVVGDAGVPLAQGDAQLQPSQV